MKYILILFSFLNLLVFLWAIELKNLILAESSGVSSLEELPVIKPKSNKIKEIPPEEDTILNDKSQLWQAFKEDDELDQIIEKPAKREYNDAKKINNSDKRMSEVDKVLPSEDKENVETTVRDKKASKNKNINKIITKSSTNMSDKNNDETVVSNKDPLYAIQVASLENENLAKKEWERLSKIYSANLNNYSYYIKKVTLKNNRIYYRLMITKFNSRDLAIKFCKDILNFKKCFIKKLDLDAS